MCYFVDARSLQPLLTRIPGPSASSSSVRIASQHRWSGNKVGAVKRGQLTSLEQVVEEKVRPHCTVHCNIEATDEVSDIVRARCLEAAPTTVRGGLTCCVWCVLLS